MLEGSGSSPEPFKRERCSQLTCWTCALATVTCTVCSVMCGICCPGVSPAGRAASGPEVTASVRKRSVSDGPVRCPACSRPLPRNGRHDSSRAAICRHLARPLLLCTCSPAPFFAGTVQETKQPYGVVEPACCAGARATHFCWSPSTYTGCRELLKIWRRCAPA